MSSTPPSRLDIFSLGLESCDDWSGISDPQTRRRLQNRLNQRACRKRKHTQSDDDTDGAIVSLKTRSRSQRPRKWLPAHEVDFLLEKISTTSLEAHTRGHPTADHLIIFSKLNVYRAFLHNLSILGMTPHREWTSPTTLSPLYTRTTGKVDDCELPTSLRPTRLQRETPHHPWLDFLPFGRMRDNLLSAGDEFDDGQLCVDVIGFWDISTKNCSLLVWGEPSDPESWEVTEEFLKKWPWVVRGLPELIESTNYWRSKRGEDRIFRYL